MGEQGRQAGSGVVEVREVFSAGTRERLIDTAARQTPRGEG